MTAQNFDQNKFMEDYNKWRSLAFWTETSESDEVFDLRYDVFELEAYMAGSFITFVDSDFKDVDDLDDRKLNNLLKRAKNLKNQVNESDSRQIDKYIEYMNLLASMHANYRRLQ